MKVQVLSGSKSTSTSSLFNGVGLFKEHLPVSERINPFFGPTLPIRKDRPIWSYKFFDGRGGAFVMPNNDLGIRFPVGNLLKKIVFKDCGSKILNCGINLYLIFNVYQTIHCYI